MDPERLFLAFEEALADANLRPKIQDKAYAGKLLGFAEGDLKDCRILFEQRQYSGAVRSLQQSSEKACKAFFLYLGLVEQKDLTKIGHDAFRMGRHALIRGGALDSLLAHFAPQNASESTIINIDPEEARNRAYSSMDRIVEHTFATKRYGALFLDNVEVWVKHLRRTGRKMSPTAARRLGEMAVTIVPAFSIAVFSSAHAVSSRYPGKPQAEEYTLDLGIVAAIPTLVGILEEAVPAIRNGPYR